MAAVKVDSQKTNPPITLETVQQIADTIGQAYSPQRIILFGSYTAGNPGPNSDLDLLVVMESDLPPYKRATDIRLLFRPTPCPMDILVFTPEEVKYWNGVANHIITEAFATGKTIYGQPE